MEKTAQPALIFIPDISGFTRFVTETEISHAQHIVTELLEILMEANQIGLEVSEVEGDAILFYRFGKAPTAAELLAQVQKMFVDFHQHLTLYETSRICQCGACKTAHTLTLKFVAHYGDIALNQVKDHVKLFGRDVIVAHRLLKNDIPHHEYGLFTHPLIKACPQWVDVSTVAWTDIEDQEQDYDSGPIKFCFLALAPLMEYVRPGALPPPIIKGKLIEVDAFEKEFPVPVEVLFEALIDLPARTKWMAGVEQVVEKNPNQVNRVGTEHKCVRTGGGKDPLVVTEQFYIDDHTLAFNETDAKGNMTARYIFEKLGPSSSSLKMIIYLKKNFLMKMMYAWFFKKRIEASTLQSFENLKEFLSTHKVEYTI